MTQLTRNCVLARRRPSTSGHHTLVALSLGIVSICAHSEELKGACQILPFDQRYKLSHECQLSLYNQDIEQARFNECFRILNAEGVRRGDCDTRDRRFVLDVKGKSPRLLALGSDGQVLYQIPLSTQNK